MAEKKSYPEEIFEWRSKRYNAAPRTKLPHQEAQGAGLRVHALNGPPEPRFTGAFPRSGDSGDGRALPLDLFSRGFEYDPIWHCARLHGVGGTLRIDSSTCMLSFARALLSALAPESCGACTACRVGIQRMVEILDRIEAGQGQLEDLDRLEDVATTICDTSLCELGKAAARPIAGTLRHFREVYLEHIRDKKKPRGHK
ncbi:MAG: hypothetical protein MUC50_12450 [Myxococcota bacterium]|jgi:NADH:ubiquinone oxidoreductase subunit F (NADH-binding)|nr:hypothetical protein [Myxococcota bacterium]